MPGGLCVEHDHRAAVGLQVRARLLVDDRAGAVDPVLELLLGGLLDVGIQRQHEVVAGGGGLLTERADRLSVGVHDVLLRALLTAEVLLVDLLEAAAPHEVVLPVLGEPVVELRILVLLALDLAEVAEHVGGELGIVVLARPRVRAHAGRHDADAGELVGMLLQVVRHALGDELGDRLRLVVVVPLVLQGPRDRLHADVEQVGQVEQHLLRVRAELVLADADLQAHPILDELPALRVLDRAPKRVRLGDLHAVVQRRSAVLRDGQHLEEPQPRREGREHEHHEQRDDLQAGGGLLHLEAHHPLGA